MSMKVPVSVYIIARDEEDRLPAAIASAQQVSDDVVVVEDGQSADNTVAVAKACGARVFVNPWPGFGSQKYFAEEQCVHDWLFCLDADEVVSPELAAEIRSVVTGADDVGFYKVRVVDVYPGARAPRLWAKPTNVVRLFRKSLGRTNTSAVHDRVDIPAGEKVGQLRSDCLHFSIRSLDHLIKKYDAYTTLQARTMKPKKKVVLAVRLFSEYPFTFFQYYILHRHFTGGMYGFCLSRVLANARWQRILKMWEKAREGMDR